MYKIVTLYAEDDMKVVAEILESDVVFLHTTVFEFSKTQLKWARQVFQAIKEEMYLAGYDSVYSYTQNVKYAKAIDPSFEVIGTFEKDGKVFEVIEWELTQ